MSRSCVSQLAYLASRLDALSKGEPSVLDHWCLLFISNMWSGSKHDATKLPILLAGGMGKGMAAASELFVAPATQPALGC